ncbi:MAG: GSCFA domain-containing protein [Arenibacterium sp.]
MPYRDLPPHSFWKSCREADDFRLGDIYVPGFAIAPEDRIATAGSCFAQNISRYLRRSNLTFHEVEPTPRGMPAKVAERFGYGLYSARYGNIYTARQLRQLIEDAENAEVRQSAIWAKDTRWFDALRPGVEPEGLSSMEEVAMHRFDHLRHVRDMFETMDVFVFTLGLTEGWTDKKSGRVFPSAPGVIAGEYDQDRHVFSNFSFSDVLEDLQIVVKRLRAYVPKLRIIFTVSPVPLTATASGQHVLSATTYSKSVLRAVAGELADKDPLIDYFPSFEMISGLPFGSKNYNDNLRTVSQAAVAGVMDVFFAAHDAQLQSKAPDPLQLPLPESGAEDDDICEEALLEAFAGQ